jgi:hypothetical protein
MELTEKLEFCRRCQKRERTEKGLLFCGLTHNYPEFELKCKDYLRDETEPENYLDDAYPLSTKDIKEKLDPEAYQKFRLEQNLGKAIIFGVIAGLAGAILWALISYYTGYQIGYMAIGIGALVGFTVKYFGKGFEQSFAYTGATISLISCLLGNLLTVAAFAAKEFNIGIFSLLGALNFSLTVNVMVETFNFIDILFYGIAIYEGFRFATNKYTERTLWQHVQKYK